MSSALVGAAVEEAARHDPPVFAHASSVDELREAVTHGVRAEMHLVKDPSPPGGELLAEMEERGIFYVPTLSLFVWAGAWGDPGSAGGAGGTVPRPRPEKHPRRARRHREALP